MTASSWCALPRCRSHALVSPSGAIRALDPSRSPRAPSIDNQQFFLLPRVGASLMAILGCIDALLAVWLFGVTSYSSRAPR